MSGEVDKCRSVEVDGQIVRVRGDREMNDADKAALTEVVAAARRYLEQQSLDRYERDPDAFIAGSQNALDRLLSGLARAGALTDYIEDLAADILDDTNRGELT